MNSSQGVVCLCTHIPYVNVCVCVCVCERERERESGRERWGDSVHTLLQICQDQRAHNAIIATCDVFFSSKSQCSFTYFEE